MVWAACAFTKPRASARRVVDEVQAKLCRRVLRALARRGLLEREDAEAMGAWDHGAAFSLDAAVRVEANDRQGLERLLRNSRSPGLCHGAAA